LFNFGGEQCVSLACSTIPASSNIHKSRRRATVQTFLQAENETIVINGEISVTVVDILGDEVVLAIDAPEGVAVCKKEALAESEMMPIHPR
jgi:hypothetical protein